MANKSQSRVEVLRKPSETVKFDPIVKEYKFDYGPKGQIQVVENGTIDVQKEVQSHANECGLYNIIKLAVAHGLDPASGPFAKKEPGVNSTIVPETYDELFKALDKGKEAQSKLDELAKTLGKSSDELLEAAKAGNLNTLIEDYVKSLAPAKKEGEE